MKKNIRINKANFFNKKYFNIKNFNNIKNDFKFIVSYLKNKKINFEYKRIIDVACGNASFLYHLKSKYKNNKFFGLDNHKELISFNKKNKLLEGITFISKNCSTKFSNKNFDLITMLGTMNVIKDQKKIINNLLNQLNKNGLLIFNVYLNKHNIDVDVNYTQHLKNNLKVKNAIYIKSYQDIKKFITGKKISKIDIIENEYPYKIDKTEGVNMYTLKIGNKNRRSNNLNMIYDQFLCIIKK